MIVFMANFGCIQFICYLHDEYMKKIIISLFAILVLVSCSKDSPSPKPSSYSLITSTNCTIKNFDFSNRTVTSNQSCTGFRYWDLVTSGNIGYGLKSELGSGLSLIKLDLSNQSILKSNEPNSSWFDFTRLELYNDQLIYIYSTYSNSLKTESKIEFYNQNLEKGTKSLDIIASDPSINLYLTATKIFEDKLFVGYREGSTYNTLIFDLSSKLQLKKINVGSTEFLPLNGSKILCLSPTGLTIINTQTLEVEKTISSSVKSLPSVSNISAFDSKNNKVFILFEAAQPSVRAYILSTLDPNSGTIKVVNNASRNIMYPPLAYDPNSDFLLSGTGTGNALAIFNSSETEFTTTSLNDKLIKIELKK